MRQVIIAPRWHAKMVYPFTLV